MRHVNNEKAVRHTPHPYFRVGRREADGLAGMVWYQVREWQDSEKERQAEKDAAKKEAKESRWVRDRARKARVTSAAVVGGGAVSPPKRVLHPLRLVVVVPYRRLRITRGPVSETTGRVCPAQAEVQL